MRVSRNMPDFANGSPSLDTAGKPAVEVPIDCSADGCSGTLTLRAVKGTPGLKRGKTLGASDFTLTGDASVEVPLKRKAARLARRGTLRKLKVVLRYADAGGAPVSVSRVVKLSSP